MIHSVIPAELESIRSGQTRCASCRFLKRAADKYGQTFVVYVEHDPQSCRVIASVNDLQLFLEGAEQRPWLAAPFEPAQK